MEKIIEQVSKLLGKLSFLDNIALQLALVGIVLIAFMFVIAIIIAQFSKIKSITKTILGATKAFASVDQINEENIEVANEEIKKLPEEAQDGWGRFLEQRKGYPSDYMKERNVLDNQAFSEKNRGGALFLRIFGFLVVALVAVLAVLLCAKDVANLGLKDFIDDFKVVGGVVGAVVLPILFYIIFDVIIHAIYRKQRKHLQFVYKSFQDILDEKVVVYASEEEEFTSENLEEITKNIEDIIAKRLGDKEIIEVITAPKQEETEYLSVTPIAELPKEKVKEVAIPQELVSDTEQEEEVVATELEQAPSLTAEEQESTIKMLTIIVEQAIEDTTTTREDLSQMAEFIYYKRELFDKAEDLKVLDECLKKLADLDTIFENRE